MVSRPPRDSTDPPGGDAPVPNPASNGPAPPQDLNLKQVARLLGVHYMTAYRYVRNGLLPARRQGQIWLVDRSDLEAFRCDRPTRRPQTPVDWSQRLRLRLLVGDEVGAWTVMTDALSAGHTPQSCQLDLLAPAMSNLDAEVAAGGCTVAEGLVATTTAHRLVARLGGTFRHRGRSRGTVVVGSPPGEHRGLVIAILANLIRLDGFGVLELGTDTPPEAFVQSAQGVDHLVAMAIGVPSIERLPAALEVLRAVHDVQSSLPVVLIGPTVAGATLSHQSGSTTLASDGGEAVAVINRLAGRRR